MFIPPTYKWKLWFEDGTTFTSENGQPWESPEIGCFLVAQPGRDQDILASRDVYVFREDEQRWMEYDRLGHIDQQRRYARFITCVRPSWMLLSVDEFRKVLKEATIEVRGK